MARPPFESIAPDWLFVGGGGEIIDEVCLADELCASVLICDELAFLDERMDCVFAHVRPVCRTDDCENVGTFAEEVLEPLDLFFCGHSWESFLWFVSISYHRRGGKSRENREELLEKKTPIKNDRCLQLNSSERLHIGLFRIFFELGTIRHLSNM